MIELQQRYPEFPGEPWQEVEEDQWQWISLSDIKKFRFRFHGKLVEQRRYLGAYIEKEIIHARLLGKPLLVRITSGEYKR